MIGRTVSHYQILEKLGAGGMGEVYLAEDTTLKRRVALKVLPPELGEVPERLKRFQREAESLAALDHPNIVTIYSVEEADGLHFFTMGLVEGKTLDRAVDAGRLTLGEFFELAIPIADAVAAAHERGITHRDLKPANIMVTKDGRAKILDFGLAELEERQGGRTDELLTQELTGVGMVVGTVPYMSTEQVKGRRIDHRSDIFSLGVIFYELVTGQRPFKGDSSAELISSILKDTPDSVTTLNADVPRHLGRVIKRCLEKRSKDRYQSARDLYNELKGLKQEVDSGEIQPVSSSEVARSGRFGSRMWLALAAGGILVLLGALLWLGKGDPVTDSARDPGSSVASVERQMIVVLPFENQGPPDDEYFAAGMTDEITSRLSAVSGLGVISGSTATRYDRAQRSSRQIGDDLGVDYLLEGTIRWARDSGGASRVRITPRLVRTDDDLQIWSEPYDRVIDDIFSVQSDIAGRVAQQLGVSLAGTERRALATRPTDNAEAYQAYLQGMGYSLQPGIENQRRAVEMFERAAGLDPDFVLAHAKVAQRSTWLHFQPDPTDDWLAKARAALERAQTLAPEHPAVRLAEGYYHYRGFGDYERALVAFQAAAAARPNDSEVLAAIGFIHRRQGRMKEALDELELALRLDPRNSELILDVAGTYRAFRRWEEADRTLDQGIAVFPDDFVFYALKADNLVDWTGSTREARTVLRSAPGSEDLWGSWLGLDQFDRDFEAALDRLESIPREDPLTRILVESEIATTRMLQGQTEVGRQILEDVLPEIEQAIAALPANAGLSSHLGFIYALLGREKDALREGRLAVEMSSNDAYSGPRWEQGLASIYAWLGQDELAVDLLERLVSVPYEEAVSLSELRFSPYWDVLRDHPRFHRLTSTEPGS